MCEDSKFDLCDEDYYAIGIAINMARRLVKYPRIKPLGIMALGKALYALERLPEITTGIDIEFGIVYRHGMRIIMR